MHDNLEINKVAIAAAYRMLEEGINILKKSGINGKAINILLIGLAGIKKEIRQRRTEDENITGLQKYIFGNHQNANGDRADCKDAHGEHA